MKKNIIISLSAITLLILVMNSCKKIKDNLKLPDPLVHFVGNKIQSYVLTSSSVPPYTITVGTTNVSSSDRIVTVNIMSTTGAVLGTQYTLNIGAGNTVTIPGGSALSTFSVQGIYSAYPSGRIDTLVFTLSEPSIKPALFSDTVKLGISR